jgi:hypothetical protein
MVGEHTSLDGELVDTVLFLRKNRVQHIVVTDGLVDIRFHEEPSAPAAHYGVESVEMAGSDETSNYCIDKDKH